MKELFPICSCMNVERFYINYEKPWIENVFAYITFLGFRKKFEIKMKFVGGRKMLSAVDRAFFR